MAFATLSDPLLRIVAWTAAAMFALTLLLLLQIVLLRLQLVVRTKRERHFAEVWRPVLAAQTAGEKAALPHLPARDRESFLKLWNHLQESLRGPARARLTAVAEACGVVPYARALLTRKALRPRLLALTTLGNLEDRSAWEMIVPLALDADPLLSLAAARSLFQIDAAEAFSALQPQLIERADWPASQITTLLQEAGSEISYTQLTSAALPLAASTMPSDQSRLLRLLRLLDAAPSREVAPLARTILALSADNEILAHTLKLLRDPTDLPVVYQYLDHPIWFVRLQAARALARIGSPSDVSRLAALLGDPVWWVRYRTAQAVIALLRGNAQALAQLRASLDDRYGQEMLDMAMTEHGVQLTR